jgi:hypothetical protein
MPGYRVGGVDSIDEGSIVKSYRYLRSHMRPPAVSELSQISMVSCNSERDPSDYLIGRGVSSSLEKDVP